MSTLVQFLAAGVKGAESGTATFLLRGTASSAAAFLYNDFERVAQPGTNIITLDANGAAEVYCAVYCDVTLKTSAGATLRTVTIGTSAATVEVRSDSFTGTDYDGSPANTVNQPITLAAVLDKWNDSAGTTNFQVLVDGVSTNISTAFGNFPTTIFVNVKSPAYGAVGDGVTDDTTAIQAALADADGQIVFFPAGTYIVSTPITLSDANFHLMGCGYGSSIIKRTNAGDEIFTVSDATAGSLKMFDGLGFDATTNQTLELNLAPNVVIRNCSFNRPVTRSSSAGQVRIAISSSLFAVAGTRFAFKNDADAGQSAISIEDCTFTAAIGYTGDILIGPDLLVRGCLFDASAVTSGVYYHIRASNDTDAQYVGSFIGNEFRDGGSSGFAFYLRDVHAGSNFVEDDNIFTGFVAPASMQDPGHIYDYNNGTANSSRIVLGSRRGKQLSFANTSLATIPDVTCFLVAETIMVLHTNATNLTVVSVATEMPIGLTWNLVVFNEAGLTIDFNFQASGGGQTVVDDAVAAWHLLSCANAAGVVRVAVAGKSIL